MRTTYTIRGVMQRFKVDEDGARGLVKFLLSKKLIEFGGTLKKEGGKGKGENVYDFSMSGLEARIDDLAKEAG